MIDINTTQTAFGKLSSEKQQRIYDAAINEFANHGFESANINLIAKNANISIGALYKYFESKEALFLEVVHFCVEKLKALLESSIKEETTLFGKISQIIVAIQTYSRENAELNRIYNIMTTESRSELVWKMVSEMESVAASLYTNLIEEAQQKGEISADLNPKTSAFFLDNLFILLQFSYSCDYYKTRLKMFVGEEAFESDQLIREQFLLFIGKAFLK